MGRLRWILAGAGVLLVAAAVAVYFTQVPAKVANDYEQRAEPQHKRVGKAVRPVFDTFTYDTFAVVEVNDKAAPRKFLRQLGRATKRDLRELERARRVVRKAKRTLARVDADALTDVPDWPLLGGSGDVEEASDVAEQAEAYLRKTRGYVRDYQALVEYSIDLIRFGHGLASATGRAAAAVPGRPTSAEQVAGPYERAGRAMIVELARFRRHRPPEDLFSEYHRTIGETERLIRNNRTYVRAVRRDDFAKVERIRKQIRRDFKRSDSASRKDLARLMERSRFKRLIDDLERRESRISKAFQEL